MVNKSLATQALRSNFDSHQVAALVNLFKIAPYPPRSAARGIAAVEAMKRGLLFVDENGEVWDTVPALVFQYAEEAFAVDASLFNQTFYKSFADVRDADPDQLIFDQILHYLTTYGAEAVGVNIPTYVPVTELEVPDIKKDSKFRFTVIQILRDEACIARIDKYLSNLAAPAPMLRELIISLLPLTTLETDDIRSFELQVVQHKAKGTVPRQPVNQLRFIVHMITGETMLIKNRYMREMIQNAATRSDCMALDLFNKCNTQGLAAIFLRYKPIFLAFKKHRGCAPFINQLRRMADEFHRPLPQTALQNFTQIDDPAAQAEIISKATNRDLVKLLNSINTRVLAGKVPEGSPACPAVYQVRNGRTFVRESALIASPRMEQIGRMIYKTLVDRLTPLLQGKVFYIPRGIQYAIPTSEKQFIGNIPYGTRIVGLPESAFTAGVQWFNQKGQRVDIDLHMNSATKHFGWNSDYRQGQDIIYTGDLTDAPLPKGAGEAYWFTLKDQDPYIMTANLYSGPNDTEFQFCMTERKPSGHYTDRGGHRSNQNERFTFDPNEMLFAPVKLNFKNDSSLTLGMFARGMFFFYGGTLNNGIVPTANYAQFIEGLTAKLNAQMMLNFLLQHCGAVLLDEINPDTWPEEGREEFMAQIISLAPEDLAIDTLVNIVDGNL